LQSVALDSDVEVGIANNQHGCGLVGGIRPKRNGRKMVRLNAAPDMVDARKSQSRYRFERAEIREQRGKQN